ncbi:SBBP repeat-containing protein [Archangium sp.]|uniref:SBBP repeat-containing protein n=1 Tax=Archangium sp. TaxID=1872627 RepID=UPI002ED82D5B
MSARLLRGAPRIAALFVLAVLPGLARGQAWRPEITWNSYLGGSASDELQSVVVNDRGEFFVAGRTNSTNFPEQAGPLVSSTTQDALVAKYNDNGVLAWARGFGSDGDDVALDVQLVPGTEGQEVYVVGRMQSTTVTGFHTNPTPPIPVTPKNAYQKGESDAFLARLNSDGGLRWILFLGGSSADEGQALAVSSDGSKVYVGGKSNSDPASFSPAAVGLRGNDLDGFVTQVNVFVPNTPAVEWTRILGSKASFPSNADDAVASLVLRNGAIYVGGTVGSRITDTDPSIEVVEVEGFHEGASDGFVAKLNPDAGVAWFTNVGGPGSEDIDEVHELLPAPNSNEFLVVGVTNSETFLTPDGRSGSDYDAFVFRMAETGVRLEGGHRVRGSGNERMDDDKSDAKPPVPGQSHAAVDALGNVFLGGRTSTQTDGGLAMNAFDETFGANSGTNSDGFVAMVDPSLSRTVWASYVGGAASKDEWVLGLSAGPLGQLTLVGFSDSANLLPRPDAGQDPVANGLTDGFVFRLEVDPTAPLPGSVNAEPVEQGLLTATWTGFSDPETRISGYAWSVTVNGGPGTGEVLRDFTSTGTGTSILPSDRLQMEEGKSYFVTVRATNGVGRTTTVTSNAVSWSADAGSGNTPDAGADAGVDAGADAGAGSGSDAGTLPGEPMSPLGWGCGSTGGGGVAGALALMALTLLGVRRGRPAAERERARGSEH